MAAAEEYIVASRELLAKAVEAAAQHDLLEASEKGWGAAAQMVKGLAENRGWGRYGDRQLYQAVNRLVHESSDGQLGALFTAASGLYDNFSQAWMPQEMVWENLDRIKQFLDKLEGMV
jgi:hypothetical protein